MKTHFDVIVVGKGLLGSAAAKYLAQSDKKVALIGPDEPKDLNKSLVFGSHFDQARVQRLVGWDAVWTKLCAASVRAYPTLQAASGVDFHEEAGCIYVNPYGLDEYLEGFSNHCQNLDEAYQYKMYREGGAIETDFPDFKFPLKAQGVLEYAPAGFIHPRWLIQAQLAVFEQQKGAVFKDTIVEVSKDKQIFNLIAAEGNTYSAEQVLICVGSFFNYFNLIPQKLDLLSKSEVVLLAQVSEAEAHRLRNLPSLLYEIDNGEVEGIYLIQPVRYPDGNFYLKIGCNMPEDIFFETLEQVQDWFRTTEERHFAPKLREALHTLMPGLKVEAYQTKKCIISRTKHGRPYIGETNQPGLFVAGGCNGYSAMCSDAIGHVAAHLIKTQQLPAAYTPDEFQVLYS
jgi:glycine/D-amino acid oxidase-like deaminating enzyme